MNPFHALGFVVVFAALLLTACSHNPESVATKEYMALLTQSNCYGMFGAVAKQGSYTLRDAAPHLTVSQSILRAGGFGPSSEKEFVILRRGSGKFEQRMFINVDAIHRQMGFDETDIVVKAGDVIIVYDKMKFFEL